MVKLPTLIAAPLAFLYGMAVRIRHKLFELNILRSEEFDIPVVCVGNLTVGGTGKTPVTEFLIECLSADYRVGVLSRGYRRRTKGFVLATHKSSARMIGDEPRQIKLKYPIVIRCPDDTILLGRQSVGKKQDEKKQHSVSHQTFYHRFSIYKIHS